MANEKLVKIVAEAMFRDDPVVFSMLALSELQGTARSVLTALAAALRDDPEAVEAMLAKITAFPRRETVAAMRDALCDYLEKED